MSERNGIGEFYLDDLSDCPDSYSGSDSGCYIGQLPTYCDGDTWLTNDVAIILEPVFELLQKYNLPLPKLNSVATDGAPSMTGKNNGFVALLQQILSESDGSKIHHTHCIIHQEVLCTKISRLKSTTIHCFLLSELDSTYSGLSYYSEVRWLSCSEILKQFWDLKEEICKDQIITNMFDIIKAFKCKLFLWERQLKNEDLTHFPTCNKNII
ncbi:general transcription factor II-I repeat domain-containing protein 2-like [Megalopta genalis]|uniref:general transcription factor II-I repeat domain-containing protein 2-like n=1 Tax=Megalopta genalis TaxID=115081 RepID=UPI003FD21A76